jgi:hypothetical protein
MSVIRGWCGAVATLLFVVATAYAGVAQFLGGLFGIGAQRSPSRRWASASA